MMAFLSSDEGKTWSDGLMLDERRNISYPDGDQTPSGTIYIIYDRDRMGEKEILCVRITEADILARKLISPGSELRILVNKATGKVEVANLSMNSNADGKPFQTSEPRAAFQAVRPEDKGTLFETGCQLFGNRNYILREAPDYLKGRHFLFS